jgi:Synergist-CTERM protein sorting domain-containing protein
MRSQLSSLGVAGLVAACFVSLSAQAYGVGIAGRTGKQGPTCMASGCHATNPSSIVPTVQLQGPATLTAGSTGNYSLTITGGPAVEAGMNVAVSDNGGTLAAGAGSKLVSGELTHSAPGTFTNNQARFDFSFVAPATAGTVTLYGIGNSANGNNANTGDNAVATTLAITVTAAQTPDAGTGSPDAGTGGGDGDGDEDDDGGCSAAGGAPMVLLLALAAAHLRRRRD